MIDEILLVEDLLKGKGINKKCLYQHCYLLAKYYLQKGLTQVETRAKIFEWASGNHFHLDSEVINVNQIIYKAQHDKRKLRDHTVIRISDNDIKAITARFDSKRARKAALAILCYAKACADSDNEFDLSLLSFCNWLNVEYTSFTRNILQELQMFEYIERCKAGDEQIFSWNDNVKSKASKWKILVNCDNKGGHILQDNDIDTLYEDCFIKC